MKFITFIGNPIPGFILTLIVVALLYIKKYKTEGLYVLVSVATSVAFAKILKFIVHRPRPDPTLIAQFNKYSSFDSFPSGHVMFYIGFFGLIFLLIRANKIKTKSRKPILYTLLVLLVSIGLSRIYVGAHWFSDVLGAYVIGNLLLFVVFNFYKKSKLKF